MAYEITVVTGLAVSNGTRKAEMPVVRQVLDQTGTDHVKGTLSVNFETAETAIPTGDIGADDGGLLYVHNLDDTNFVTVHGTGEGTIGAGSDAGGVKILAGEEQVFRFAKTPYATADTAAVEIEYLLLEA